jgi:hypothetical protein
VFLAGKRFYARYSQLLEVNWGENLSLQQQREAVAAVNG